MNQVHFRATTIDIRHQPGFAYFNTRTDNTNNYFGLLPYTQTLLEHATLKKR